jgi:hypothetical protein
VPAIGDTLRNAFAELRGVRDRQRAREALSILRLELSHGSEALFGRDT